MVFINYSTGEIKTVTGFKDILDYWIRKDHLYTIDLEGKYRSYLATSSIYDQEVFSIEFILMWDFDDIRDAVILNGSEFVLLDNDKKSIWVYASQFNNNYTKLLSRENMDSMTFSADGSLVAIEDWSNKTIEIYSTNTLQMQARIQPQKTDNVLGYNFSFFQNYLMVYDYDTLDFYDTFTRELKNEMDFKDLGLTDLNFKINTEQNEIIFTGRVGYDEYVINIFGNEIYKFISFEDIEYLNGGEKRTNLVDLSLNNKEDKLAVLFFDEKQQKYILIEYDLLTCKYKELLVTDGIIWNSNISNCRYHNLIEYNFENDTLRAYIYDKLYIFDSQRKITDDIHTDFHVMEIKSIPGSNDIILFKNNKNIYKYSTKEHKITAKGKINYKLLYPYNIHFLPERNQLVFVADTRYKNISTLMYDDSSNISTFVDDDTLECWAEIKCMYNNSADPIAVIGSKGIEFYPYYTDKQIIDIAENIYKTYGE